VEGACDVKVLPTADLQPLVNEVTALAWDIADKLMEAFHRISCAASSRDGCDVRSHPYLVDRP